jgi:hypothetical protein
LSRSLIPLWSEKKTSKTRFIDKIVQLTWSRETNELTDGNLHSRCMKEKLPFNITVKVLSTHEANYE